MFNSPISRLFGISGVNKDNKQQKQNKKDNEQKKEDKNFFEEGSDFYTDISSQDFDAEKFIRNFVENLKNKELTPRTLKKIDEFLAKFDMKIFEQRNGKNLSKEDLTVIMYSIAEKWGISFL